MTVSSGFVAGQGAFDARPCPKINGIPLSMAWRAEDAEERGPDAGRSALPVATGGKLSGRQMDGMMTEEPWSY